jgi:hypothetical protein
MMFMGLVLWGLFASIRAEGMAFLHVIVFVLLFSPAVVSAFLFSFNSAVAYLKFSPIFLLCMSYYISFMVCTTPSKASQTHWIWSIFGEGCGGACLPCP